MELFFDQANLIWNEALAGRIFAHFKCEVFNRVGHNLKLNWLSRKSFLTNVNL